MNQHCENPVPMGTPEEPIFLLDRFHAMPGDSFPCVT
jgi:hypothetical protein